MDLLELGNGVVPERHWYYRAKAALVEDMLRDKLEGADSVMDVGAGSGFFSRYLLKRHQIREAFCVDPNYETERDEIWEGKKIQFVRQPGANKADVLLLMDVLEHVEDDEELLRRYLSHISPGGSVLITVPAFQFLWSAHDEILGHHRRYTLREVVALAKRAGVLVDQARYFYGAVFPAAALIRILKRTKRQQQSDMSSVPAFANAILERISRLELRLARNNRAFGLTATVMGHVA